MASSSVAELLRKRAKDLTRHLTLAIRGDIRGVHQGRVASRRLRESLPAAGGRALGLKGARKSFREITRALGPVRELDVALGHLEDGLDAARIPRAAIEKVRAHVLAEREQRRVKMLNRLERVDVAEALARVERIAGAAAAAPGGREPALTLVRRIRARALGLQLAVEKAGTLYHPDRLHNVRIAAKKLRYALEVAKAASIGGIEGDLKRLKRAQESLGVMHDYQVLLEHVRAVSGITPRGSRGAAGLAALDAAYDRECRKLHGIYLKMAPGLAASAARLRVLPAKRRQSTR